MSVEPAGVRLIKRGPTEDMWYVEAVFATREMAEDYFVAHDLDPDEWDIDDA